MNHQTYLADRSNRSRLAIQGPDRAKFLHNLTTNDVKRLAVGHGQESFITSPQGKTLAYMNILAAPDKLLLRSDPNGFMAALPHLQKYGIFDEITLEDVSPATFEFHLAGDDAEPCLKQLGIAIPGPAELSHTVAELGTIPLLCVRESPLGSVGFTLIGPIDEASPVWTALQSCHPVSPDSEGLERLRILAGVPAFGQDVNVNNLPQEVCRDTQAISFVKGCYLGQETVARIDALGHVNKRLVGLLISGGSQRPEPGWSIEHDGKNVGVITSLADLDVGDGYVALGYLKATVATGDTEATVLNTLAEGAKVALPARLVDLPIDPGLILRHRST